MAEKAWVGASDNSSISPGSSVTYYGNWGESAFATATAQATRANAALVHRGSNCTLKNVRASVVTNARGANSTITTGKNGSNTSQVVTITASTTGLFTDLTNTVDLVATDTFGYELVIGSTSGAFLVSAVTANLESASQSFNYISSNGAASTAVASVTRYWSIAGLNATPSTSEANVQSYAPAAGTLSNLRAYVTVARATDTTFRLRVGGADVNQTVTLTGGVTGAFEDTTNTDAISAGDLLSFTTATGTGTDTLTVSCTSIKYLPSTASVSALISGPNTSLNSGATRYYNPMGRLVNSATEANNQSPAPFGGTAAVMCAVVSANASTTTATFVLRNAAADTAVTFTVTGGATGSFADTTNTATIGAADLISIKGSGTDGTLTLRAMGLKYTASAATEYAQAASATTTPVASTVRQTGKPLSVDNAALASLVRQTGKIVSATVTPVASIVRDIAKAISASNAAAASLVRQTAKALSVSNAIEASLSVSRQFLLSLQATTTPVASLVRQTGKALSAVNAAVASLSSVFTSAPSVLTDFLIKIATQNRTGKPSR